MSDRFDECRFRSLILEKLDKKIAFKIDRIYNPHPMAFHGNSNFNAFVMWTSDFKDEEELVSTGSTSIGIRQAKGCF